MLAFFLLFNSCANLGDSTTDLGDGYFFEVDGGDAWIRADYIMKNGIYPNIINYAFDNKFIIALQRPTLKGYRRLLAQDLRERYNQMLDTTRKYPHGIDEVRFLNSHLWMDTNIHRNVIKVMLPDNQTSFEKMDLIADSLVKNDPYFKYDLKNSVNYWIIIKKDNVVLGPLTEHEFNYKKKQMKIPADLILKEND